MYALPRWICDSTLLKFVFHMEFSFNDYFVVVYFQILMNGRKFYAEFKELMKTIGCRVRFREK